LNEKEQYYAGQDLSLLSEGSFLFCGGKLAILSGGEETTRINGFSPFNRTGRDNYSDLNGKKSN